VSDITDAVLEQIKDTELFKDLIENAVESSEKVAELAEAGQNADQLAAAVGANRQTAEAIIGNAWPSLMWLSGSRRRTAQTRHRSLSCGR
jgi:hypothetical protein